MNSEKEINLGKADILAITNEYLQGRISFETYTDLERKWIHRYSHSKSYKINEMPHESQVVSDVRKKRRNNV